MHFITVHLDCECLSSEKAGAKPAVTEAAPAASAPAKRLDNLFFIEEPKNANVTESKWVSL